ncbi:MAG: S8 family serine peptidase [Anaerolineaceae bacterium]|nr:S8 family serine peptidase [Anaerolineaceae bacterium]
MFAKFSSRLLLILFLVTGFFLLAASYPPGVVQDGYLPDEVVVKLVQAADLPAVAADYNLDPLPLDQFGTRPIFRLRILDGVEPTDRAEALAADARVVYAEPNFLGQAPEGRQRTPWAIGGGSGEYVDQWAPATLRLAQAHTVTEGAGITVAILDTGVDRFHFAFADRLMAGYDFVDMDDDPSEVGVYGLDPAYGHGTHVAGIVALTAPEATLLPVRVLDRDGVGNIWVLAEALAFAVDPDSNPLTNDGADVINMSLGTTRRTNLLAEIVAEITCGRGEPDDDDDEADDDDSNCSGVAGYDVVVVAAAGNRGAAIAEYPAAEQQPGLLAVAASTPIDTLADFSSFGSWVQVAAPGEYILSSVPGGGYGTWSGTSMAAPFAAGQAALMRSAFPELSAVEVVEEVEETAVPITGPIPLRIDPAAALGLPSLDEGACWGSLGSVEVDDLFVPSGAICSLQGTNIDGAITVEEDATLLASQVTVSGDIKAGNASLVIVKAGSIIAGNIELKESSSGEITDVQVDGNVLFESNSGTIDVIGNWIGGNLQAYKNTGTLTLTNNIIEGNLQCKENSPPPDGSNNIVHGNREDQCVNLGN